MFTEKVLTSQVTISHDSDAYTANDVVGGLLTFNVPSPSSSGILNGLKVTDEDNEGAALDVYIFNDVPSTIADDAAGALTIADLDKCITKVEIAAADYEAVNSLKFAIKTQGSQGMNVAYNTDSKGNLYAYVICTGTPTYAADKTIKMELTVLTS